MTECNHTELEMYLDKCVTDTQMFLTMTEVVRCPSCQQTYRPSVDKYDSDVYLVETPDPREMNA